MKKQKCSETYSSHAGNWSGNILWCSIGLGLFLIFVPPVSAGWWSKILSHDIDVITVTDMTDEGRAYPPASLAKPVYYMLIDVGQRTFGRTWAGEITPKTREARKWIMAALAEQGYRLADNEHPPTQLFVFGWGMMQGGKDRPALGFLGGDKVNLMWEQVQYGGFVDPKVLLRGIQRVGITGKVWDIAESDLFLGIVRSFSMDSLDAPKTTLLWETRFACPATGLTMNTTLPLMIKAAAPNLGRETKVPVNLNASDAFRGRVDLGELKFLTTEPSKPEENKQSETMSPKPDTP